MSTTRFAEILGVVLCSVLAIASQARSSEPEGKSKKAPPEDAIRAAVAEYAAAYNRHDAAELASMWTEKASYEDEQTGESLSGREAIRRDFSAILAEQGDLKLQVHVERVHFIRPDVVQVTGRAVTTVPDESPRESRFRAVLVREGGRWLIDDVIESLVPAAVEPANRLRDLEFLVGQWRDDNAEARVVTTVRWSSNRSFLIRSYTVDRGDGATYEGSQVIGWDPRQEGIRCWTFDSDGSFGEGTWTPSQEGWTVKYSQTLPDGSRAGATQVISRVDDNTLMIQSVGQEIAGHTLPASEPIRVVRVDADAEK